MSTFVTSDNKYTHFHNGQIQYSFSRNQPIKKRLGNNKYLVVFSIVKNMNIRGLLFNRRFRIRMFPLLGGRLTITFAKWLNVKLCFICTFS